MGMFPKVKKFKVPGGRKFKDKCAHKHTAKPADENMPPNDERQMQIRKIQSDDKTQYRVRVHHVANKYVLKGELGTYTWSHPDQISKSAKPTRSDSRKDLSNGL